MSGNSLNAEARDAKGAQASEASRVPPGPDDTLLQVVLGGRFELRALLGGGAYGNVYLADDRLHRVEVAVKVLHRSVAADREIVARFVREGEAIRRLVHPNVVVVHEAGEDRGHRYLVMEYVAGGTLAAHLSSAPKHPRRALPSLSFALAVTGQLLDALAVAHDHHVIHRDLKPENVLLADAELPHVKVADFGLARIDVAGIATLTQQDSVAGTVEFMSPEQCRSLRVGPAADLYSVGCILTELLQGRPPFVGRTAAEVVAGHLFAEVGELERAPGLPAVPPELERLRRALLAKQPHQRPPSAAAARTLLAAMGSGHSPRSS